MKYYISDLHLFHENAIHFDQRPFESVQQMHDTILKNWNDRVMNGDYVYPEGTPMIRIGYSNSTEFTNREFDIIRELAQGRKYEEIAADLDITLNTVKYHVKNILQKTGYQNTLQLVAEVVEKRLILPKY